MTTATITRGIAWAVARCRCGKTAFKVQGGKGLLVSFTCADRGCRQYNETVLT